MHHLLVGCVVSRMVWYDIFSWCRLTTPPPDGTMDFYDWWAMAIHDSSTGQRKGLASLVALTAWTIWRHRNACIFDGATPSTTLPIHDIKEEARTWANAGARGLSSIIGVT